MIKKTDTFWLWGWHPVVAALENPLRPCHQVVATEEIALSLGPFLKKTPIKILKNKEMDMRFPASVHQSVAVQVSSLPSLHLHDFLSGKRNGTTPLLFLVLDQVTDPHNVGSLIRTAAAFQATGVILPQRHAPPFTGVLAKSASGALEKLPIFHITNLAQTLLLLKKYGVWCVGLTEKASTGISELNLNGSLALVMGGEGKGLRRLTQENCDFLVRLPTSSSFPTLNVSNAGAVALYAVSEKIFPSEKIL